ncbi:MAG TPA: ATP-binding protein [Gemmatimonadaceae bacterium]
MADERDAGARERVAERVLTRETTRDPDRARERALAAERWAPLLDETSRALSASIDEQETLRLVPRLAVRFLADWSIVYARSGSHTRLEVAHADPAREPLVRSLCDPALGPTPASPLVLAVRTGVPQLIADVGAERLETIATNPAQLEALRELHPSSVLAVPLAARGEVRGAVLLALDAAGERYGADDLVLAVEFARRAALAVDNALLYSEARERISDLGATLEATADGILVVDPEGRITSCNRRFMEMWGLEPEVLQRRDDRELLARVADLLEDPVAFRERVDRLYADPTAESRDIVRLRDGRIFERYSRPRLLNGRSDGRVWSFSDVTERERHAAEQRFLAEASSLLAASLDHAETLRSIARLAVPLLGDWCQVEVLERDGRIRHVAIAHRDAGREHRLRELQRRHGLSAHPAYSSARVIESGAPWIENEVPAQRLEQLAGGDAGLLAELRELAPASIVSVPLVARGERIGALVLARETPGRPYGDDELRLAGEIASRAALAAANARLYADVLVANRAKSDFLAVMSHELRTPLTTVIGYAELLADGVSGPVTESQRQQLGRVMLSGQHLLQLIEEILAFARIEAGRETVRLDPVDLVAIVREAVAIVEPHVPDGVELVVDVADAPIELRTDAKKVRQILLNLLSNALKFTSAGEVGVSARRTDDGARLRVWDTGSGIAPEHSERIFQPFWQVEQLQTRRTGGTGLGLSVTRHLTNLLGGEIELASVPGEGSRFTVTLPRAAPEDRG